MSPWVQFALNIYEKCRLCTQYLWYEVQIEIVIINFAIINKEKLNFGVFVSYIAVRPVCLDF